MNIFIWSGKDTEETNKLKSRYQNCKIENADIIISLGGDGSILKTIHYLIDHNLDIPIYGLNYGNLGFLSNPQNNIENINFDNLKEIKISPLSFSLLTEKELIESYAINDVFINRKTAQACKLNLKVNDIQRIECFSGDGIIISTPVGSTAYNRSAGGSILPLDSNLLSITPICGFSPKYWRGALLPDTSKIYISLIENEKRPVTFCADYKEYDNFKDVEIRKNNNISIRLLYNQNFSLDEKIIQEQF